MRALVTTCLEVLGILTAAAAASLGVAAVSTAGGVGTGAAVLIAGAYLIERRVEEPAQGEQL